MWNSLSQFMFGMECVSCGSPSEELDPWLCKDCQKRLLKMSQNVRFPSDSAISLYSMNELTRKLIHILKYRGVKKMASYLVSHSQYNNNLSLVFNVYAKPFYFIPVPLHRSRFRERGYNQAEQIAFALAKSLKGNVCRWIKRKSFRVSQTKLDKNERQLNVIDAFVNSVSQKIPKKGTVFIVDDVYTTGATTNACRAALGKDFPLDVKVCTLLYDEPATAVMDLVADTAMAWDEK